MRGPTCICRIYCLITLVRLNKLLFVVVGKIYIFAFKSLEMTVEAKDAKFEVADDIRVGRLLLLLIATGSVRHNHIICLLSFIDKVICLYPVWIKKLVGGSGGWPIG